MKLDVDVLRYLSKDEFRVLTAVEMGMKNHEIVPVELIDRIAGLKHGGVFKNVKTLLRHKLVHHDSSKYDGYRLTNLGYDFLAIKTLANRGLIAGVGRQIGVGKESDIFEVVAEDGQVLALKLHRLGRTSFRAVKSKRDYLKHRSSFNWLYLSRLAALKEYAFMKALGYNGFPVPKAVEWNRHCVLMSLVPGYPLVQVKQLQNPDLVFQTIIGLIVRLAEHGLIHCDFNEFNIMVDDDEAITMIDFPQMVSVSHRNAEMYFDRDVNCILKFFNKRFSSTTSEDDESSVLDAEAYYNERPDFHAVANLSATLDKQLEASGFTRQDQKDLEQYALGSKDEDEINEKWGCDRKSDSEDDGPEGGEALVDDIAQVTMISNLDSEDNGVETSEEVFTEGQNNTEYLDNGSDHSEHETSTDNSFKDVKHSKNLEKRRRQAASAVRPGTKSHLSRNTKKDKGGRRSRHGVVGSKLDF